MASAAFTVLAVETGFRLSEDRPWYVRLTEEQRESQEYTVKSRRLDRLRDREYRPLKPPGHFRILMLGDSFTYGLGVEDDARIFPEILERRFNELKPDPRVVEYELLNAGIPMYLTGEWVERFKSLEVTFQPDFVVAVFFLRDGTLLGFQRNFVDPLLQEMAQWRREDLLARWSAAWRTLYGRIRMLEISRRYIDSFHQAYFGADPLDTAEWSRARDNLRFLHRSCAETGRQFHLAVFPMLFELHQRYPFADICEEIERFGGAEGIPTFSLLPAFRNRDASRLWVAPFDQHPNEEGHQIAADALEAYLRPHLENAAR